MRVVFASILCFYSLISSLFIRRNYGVPLFLYRLYIGAILYGDMAMFIQLAGTLSASFSALVHLLPAAVSFFAGEDRAAVYEQYYQADMGLVWDNMMLMGQWEHKFGSPATMTNTLYYTEYKNNFLNSREPPRALESQRSRRGIYAPCRI